MNTSFVVLDSEAEEYVVSSTISDYFKDNLDQWSRRNVFNTAAGTSVFTVDKASSFTAKYIGITKTSQHDIYISVLTLEAYRKF